MRKRIIEIICFTIIIISAICGTKFLGDKNKIEEKSILNQKQVDKYIFENIKEIEIGDLEYEFIKAMTIVFRTSYIYENVVDVDNKLYEIQNTDLGKINDSNNIKKNKVFLDIKNTNREFLFKKLFFKLRVTQFSFSVFINTSLPSHAAGIEISR